MDDDVTLPVEESTAAEGRIGPYRLLTLLGQGGMGEVYKAVHIETGRCVALKVVNFKHTQLRDHLERVTQEAMAMASLRHPSVVTCYSVGEDGHRLYLALELMSGGDTVGLVKKHGGRLDEGTIRALALACVGGLAAIHRVGLVHRDIKPANILLDAEGLPKLADFGLACFHEASSGTLIRVGTPSYMPPEAITGEGLADTRGDIYSLGVTMHFWATGAAPFLGANPHETLHRVLAGQAPDLAVLRPDLSADLRAIIVKAMHPARERRFQDPDEFATALQAHPQAADETTAVKVSHPRLDAAHPEPQPAATWPLSWLVAAVLGTLSVAGLAVAAQHPAPAPAPTRPQALAPGLAPADDYRLRWLGDPHVHFVENGPVSYSRSGTRLHLGDEAWLDGSAGTPLVGALRSSGDLAIEVVMRPANLTQEGPAQILGIGLTARSTNLMLGQSGTRLELRLRTSATNPDGTRPHLISEDGVLTGAWQHVVVVRHGTHNSIFVDGRRCAEAEVSGDLSAWDPSPPIAVGNVHRGGFPWSGSLDRMVFSTHAWGESEVAQAYRAWASEVGDLDNAPEPVGPMDRLAPAPLLGWVRDGAKRH